MTLALMCMMLFSMVLPVHADKVEMTGTFSEMFELNTDGDSIFDIPIMNPGDRWENKVEIENTTGETMEVRLFEVVNKIEDDMLFNVLKIKITIDGEVFFEGTYNNIPQSEWIALKDREKVVFEIEMEFPGECGNEYQAKVLNSEWKFEARLPEGAPTEPSDPDTPTEPDDEKPSEPTTPPDDNPVPTGDARIYYITGMLCLGACILFIVVGKKDEKDDKKRTR